MRKKIVDLFLKKFLDEVPVAEQKRLAAEAGVHPPRTLKKGEQSDIFRPSTSEIERWVDEGAPGLSEHVKRKKRIAEEDPLARLRASQKRLASEAREREELLELDFDRPRTGKEISELFEIEQRTGELTKQLDTLKTTGQATKNLEDFTEALTNKKIIEAAIKAGYAKPGIWDQAQGLPPWPKELRKADTIAKIRLGIDPERAHTASFPSDIQREKIRAEIRKLSGANGRTPEEVMSKIDQEQINKNVQELMAGREIPGRSIHQRRLSAEEKEKIEQLQIERADSGLDFSPEERIKGESGKPRPSPQEEVEASWRRVASDPRAEPPTGVHPRTGEILPEELPWSLAHEQKYDALLREKRINDPNYMPTAIEERALQQQAAEELDKEWPVFSDKFLTVDMPRPSDVRHIAASGEETIIPVTKGRQRLIRGDVGSPASAMHEPMRGRGATEEAIDDMGLLPEQDIAFTADNIDTELVMQRYQNPQAVLEKLRQDPDIAISPDVNIDRAIQQRIDRVGGPAQVNKERTLERISARPEFKRYMQDTAETFEPDRQLDLPIRIEPTAEVSADLRSRAAELTRRGQQFKREVSELPVEQRKQAEIEIINRPEFREFQAARRALKREIGVQAPDLMEFDPYTRSQKTIDRPRMSARPRILEAVQLDMIDELLKQETILDRAFAEGKININNPQIMARWKADVPRREAKRKLLEESKKEMATLNKMKGLIASEKRMAKNFNKMQDELDAIGTGFIKKDKTANLAAWKKAGRPKPLDWKDPPDFPRRSDFIIDPSGKVTKAGREIKPKRKLVDTFKKGRKIVNRKRGGLLKKPRGWGAARYKGT